MKNEILKTVLSIDAIPKDELKIVVAFVSKNPEILKELIPLLYHDNKRAVQKTGLVLSELAIDNPDLFIPYTSSMLEKLYKKSTDAVKRNTLRVLQYVPIPKNQHDAAVDLCFQYLVKRNEAVAIQVFAMTVLVNLVKEYPELKNELVLILEDRMPNGSAGFRSRAKRTLQILK